MATMGGRRMNKKIIELLKKFASSPAGKMKHDSTGIPEIDEMLDAEAERIYALILEAEE